jgi:DNA invertase Pin-like site-specific DNA recombinase
MNVRHLRVEDLRGLRWRGYVRESTAAQADKWSPERQRSDIVRAADDLGLTAAEPTFYERTGSGEAESSELALALADAKRGQYDVLLVLTTSRFARNRTEAVRVKALFRKANVPIYFVHERIVSGSRDSALNEGVREVLDENENETRRMWIAGGLRERMLSGRWSGKIPVGYRRVVKDFPDGTRRWDGGLEPDPVTAPVIRRIFSEFAAGTAPLDIAHALNTEGARGPQGPWERSGLVKVLRNPVYKGELVRYRNSRPTLHYFPEDDASDGRQVIATAWEPIIPEPMWTQVQALMDRRVTSSGPHRTARRYPLSGVVRCGACGRSMSGVASQNAKVRYYRCRARTGDRSCTAPYARAEHAELAFAKWIGSLHLPADWREAIAGTREVSNVGDNKAERLTATLARIKKLYAWGDMEEDEYRAESARVKAEMAAVVQPSESSMEAVAAALGNLAESWATARPERQSAVARLMLSEIVVRDGQATLPFVARAEIKPLLELCSAPRVATDGYVYSDRLRYSA